MRRILLLLAILSLIITNLSSQVTEGVNFRYPLDLPMSISGNYAELRSNHFHSGIDFRVGGVVGAPIFAAEDGYISRIVVSPTGYGNGLYLTHKNGYVTVYGHLYSFNDKIKKIVRERQNSSQEFRQDIYLSPLDIVVKRGDLLGKAGNSGSSGGPHLHFELRDSSNKPLDIFSRGVVLLNDKTAPIINKVSFSAIVADSGAVRFVKVGDYINNNSVIKLPQRSFISIDAVDRQENTNAKLAVNEYKVYLDNNLIYHLTIGEYSYDKDRYINALIDYGYRGSNYFIKSLVEPGNFLKNKIISKNSGEIELIDDNLHTIKVEVVDWNNNSSSKSYNVIRDNSLLQSELNSKREGVLAIWHKPTIISRRGVELYIPFGSLYSNKLVYIDTLDYRVTSFAPVWRVGEENVALHNSLKLAIDCNIPDSLALKAVMVKTTSAKNFYSVGGRYNLEKKRMEASISSFGDYSVAFDFAPPIITPQFRSGAKVHGGRLVYRIRDNLSGMKRYRVEIDGEWVLAEYDAKTRRVIVPIGELKLRSGKHNISIRVWDNVDNEAVLKSLFVL